MNTTCSFYSYQPIISASHITFVVGTFRFDQTSCRF